MSPEPPLAGRVRRRRSIALWILVVVALVAEPASGCREGATTTLRSGSALPAVCPRRGRRHDQGAARRATETVRYIGVDTPETVKPDTPVQCYGHAASAANRRLVGGGRWSCAWAPSRGTATAASSRTSTALGPPASSTPSCCAAATPDADHPAERPRSRRGSRSCSVVRARAAAAYGRRARHDARERLDPLACATGYWVGWNRPCACARASLNSSRRSSKRPIGPAATRVAAPRRREALAANARSSAFTTGSVRFVLLVIALLATCGPRDGAMFETLLLRDGLTPD